MLEVLTADVIAGSVRKKQADPGVWKRFCLAKRTNHATHGWPRLANPLCVACVHGRHERITSDADREPSQRVDVIVRERDPRAQVT